MALAPSVRGRVVLASLLLPIGSVYAQGNVDKVAKVITVDATNGQISGPVRFKVGDRVRLRVTNINPFIHVYRFVERERVTYTETAISTFAKIAFGFTIPESTPKLSGVTSASASLDAMGTLLKQSASFCEESAKIDTLNTRPTAQAAGIVIRLKDLLSREALLQSDIEAFQNDAGKAFTETADDRMIMKSAESRAETLRAAAKTVSDKFKAFASKRASDSLSLPARAAAIIQETQSLSTTLDNLSSKYPSCAFPTLRALVATVAADTAPLRAQTANVKTIVQAAGGIADGAAAAAADYQRLEASRWFGPFDDPSRIVIDIQRSTATPDTLWRSIAAPNMSFGGRRQFGVVIGIQASKIGSREYSVVREYVQEPATAADSVVSVARPSSSRAWLVTPAIGLSTRLFYLNNRASAVHSLLSVGATVGDGKTTANYHLGIAVSFANERVMLSGGLTSGLGKGLAPGATDNARVPLSQTSVPTAESRLNRIGIGLFYRAF